MNELIPYGKHHIDDDDIKAVLDVLKNKNLTHGSEVEKFEKKIAKYVGSKYAVAVSSWTSGLHLANKCLGITKGDSVITSPVSFVATSNSVLYCGAKPIFSDINPETGNLCPNALEKKIKDNPDCKAIIPVHYSGVSCQMDEIYYLARKYNLKIIEDSAHALGGSHNNGEMVGSCSYSDISGFSFHPVKSIATGEGGILTTNNQSIHNMLLKLRSHGINKRSEDIILKNQSKTFDEINPWYYEMQELGYNYRLTDIQCSLGSSQLKKLPIFIKKRKILVKKYDKEFSGLEGVKTLNIDKRDSSSHHLYVLMFDFNKIQITKARLMNSLREKESLLKSITYQFINIHFTGILVTMILKHQIQNYFINNVCPFLYFLILLVYNKKKSFMK